jgi:putative alpha-1,2-mannosidase
VRQILDTVYGTGPSGLPGNDDLGTMSAWYVFSALGVYPRTPGSAGLLLGAPVFTSALIGRTGRGDIRINAPRPTTPTPTSPRPPWTAVPSTVPGPAPVRP